MKSYGKPKGEVHIFPMIYLSHEDQSSRKDFQAAFNEPSLGYQPYRLAVWIILVK